jgi:hypothetical protein
MCNAMTATGALAAAIGLASWVPAIAQTCPARPPLAACTAAAPRPGDSFSGPVLQVIDRRTICVALGPLPSQWIQVMIADSDAHGTRGALMAAAFAQDVACVATGETGGAVRAVCLVDGVSVGRLANSPEIRMQAGEWR